MKGERYLPDEMPDRRYYRPVPRGLEIKIGEALARLRGEPGRRMMNWLLVVSAGGAVAATGVPALADEPGRLRAHAHRQPARVLRHRTLYMYVAARGAARQCAPFLDDGVLGGFTTYSAFALERAAGFSWTAWLRAGTVIGCLAARAGMKSGLLL